MQPVFKCDACKIEAHYYKSLSEHIWIVRCLPCGAKAVYNDHEKTVTPYFTNKNRPNEYNIFIERFIEPEEGDDKKKV